MVWTPSSKVLWTIRKDKKPVNCGIFFILFLDNFNICRNILPYWSGYHTVDPHFSRASPLDRRDSLFIYLWKIDFFLKKVGVATYFIFFKRENKTRNKTLKNDSIIFGKACLWKNPSPSPGIRLLIGKAPLGGSTPLSPKEVSTN